MYGAIIGDLAGSIYEYEQTKGIKPVTVNNIIEKESFYSDDTILTIAIADAIMNGRDYEKYLKYYIQKYQTYRPDYKPYFKTSFSQGIIKWSTGKKDNLSIGNGALMRISPVGYLFNTEEEVINEARLATIPSHNTEEAILSSKTIALVIFYLRQGMSKEEIYQKLNITLRTNQFNKFNSTCHETIDNCLYVLYNSSSFEDALRTIISYGGDTDTNACIVGSMAEALYGIPDYLIEEANKKIPEEFIKVLKKTNYRKGRYNEI